MTVGTCFLGLDKSTELRSYLGAKAHGYNAGLFRLMAMCPRTGDFRQSFATLLAACTLDHPDSDSSLTQKIPSLQRSSWHTC